MIKQYGFLQRVQKAKKADITVIVVGIMLLFFWGSMIITRYMHDDFVITKLGYVDFRDLRLLSDISRFVLTDINLILHALLGLSLILSPLRPRFSGSLATTLALSTIVIMGYSYTQRTHLQSFIGLIFIISYAFLILVPSLYVLFTAFKTQKPA